MGILKSILLGIGESVLSTIQKSEDAYNYFSSFDNKTLKFKWENRKWLSNAERNGLKKAISERLSK